MTLQLEAQKRPLGHGAGRQTGRLGGIAFVITSLLASGRAQADDQWLGPDKALHFSASAGVAALGYGATSLATGDRGWRAGIGFGAALAVGAAKEGYDATGRGEPSWKDFTWDAIGAAVGVGIAFAIDVAVRGTAPSDSRSASRGALVLRW